MARKVTKIMHKITLLLLAGIIGFSIAFANHLALKGFTLKALKKTYSQCLAMILSGFLFRLLALGCIFFIIYTLWREAISTVLIFFLVSFHILLIKEGRAFYYNH